MDDVKQKNLIEYIDSYDKLINIIEDYRKNDIDDEVKLFLKCIFIKFTNIILYKYGFCIYKDYTDSVIKSKIINFWEIIVPKMRKDGVSEKNLSFNK